MNLEEQSQVILGLTRGVKPQVLALKFKCEVRDILAYCKLPDMDGADEGDPDVARALGLEVEHTEKFESQFEVIELSAMKVMKDIMEDRNIDVKERRLCAESILNRGTRPPRKAETIDLTSKSTQSIGFSKEMREIMDKALETRKKLQLPNNTIEAKCEVIGLDRINK